MLYDAGHWGVGELWLEDDVLVWHELPRPGLEPSARSHPLAERMAAYFAGERVSLDDVELDLDWCSPFQRAVAEALRTVPYGETVTYGELAALAGYPNAQRAAGTFCARNRLPLLLPCHRVVAAAFGRGPALSRRLWKPESLGSYGSLGVEYKRRLLELEGAL